MHFHFLKKPVFWIVFLGALISLSLVGYLAYQNVRAQEQRSLVERAQSIAAALSADEILALAGDESDLNNPAYWSIKNKLVRIGEVNADVTSAYLMGLYLHSEYGQDNLEEIVFFFADSVASGDVDEAEPGLTYEEATPLLKTVFYDGVTVFEGPVSDRWGSWVSGLAPVISEQTGEVVALFGIDVDSKIYWRKVLLAMAVPILIVAVLFLIIASAYIHYTKNRELLNLKAKFVSIASHEMRSPVAGIVWAAQSLVKQAGAMLEPGVRKTIGLIEEAGKRLLQTVSDILDLSRLQGAEANKVVLVSLNLRELVEGVMKSLALVSQERGVIANLDVSFPASITAMGDRQRTERVVANILTNALKYSPRGAAVEVGYHKDPKKHVISVADHGVGIPEGEQDKIFGGGFRASNAEASLVAGSGMGLHMVRELMQSQGGDVTFVSKPGEGTTFFIEVAETVAST